MTTGRAIAGRRSTARFLCRGVAAVLLALLAHAPAARAEDQPSKSARQPSYLYDRGTGIATSLFGTYVRKGEWLVYTFYEYTRTQEFEYKPSELGFAGGEDFLGKLYENENLIFVSHGITDRMMFEIESAVRNRASFRKDPTDPSAVPGRIAESGLGDTQAELRWRWSDEKDHSPELFSFFEVVFPLQKDRVLIGTQDWEYSLGFGAIKGHRWGTLTGRVAVTYDGADATLDLGEYAIEYLKRVSHTWRLVAAVEGESDEVSLIGEAQARLGEHLLLKLNCGFGVTAKTPDLAPEAGLLFSW